MSHTPSFIHLHQSNSHHTTGIDKTLGFCRDVARARATSSRRHTRARRPPRTSRPAFRLAFAVKAPRAFLFRVDAPPRPRDRRRRVHGSRRTRETRIGGRPRRAPRINQSSRAERSCVENARDRGTNRDIDVIRARCCRARAGSARVDAPGGRARRGTGTPRRGEDAGARGEASRDGRTTTRADAVRTRV